MATDLLSDVLGLVRLTGALIFEVETGGAWGVTSRPLVDQFARLLPPGTTQVIAFHILLDGECWVHHAACGWINMRPGHAVVVAHGDPHDLCDGPGRATTSFETMLGGRTLPDLRRVCMGQPAGAPTRILCGFVGCDQRAFAPLCHSLPAVFKVLLGARMDTLVRYAVTHGLDDEPGSAALRGRLAELLFLSALRVYMRDLPQDATGWLAGLRDPLVGRALQALHADPCRHWSMDGLASAIASSRSTLAERFRAVIGEAPMHYLTRLRMQLAARRLEASHYSVARVADEVGYESSAAFQRAFKRCFGVPPATWRRQGATPSRDPLQ